MTISLLARCERSGRFGMALTSSSPAVAARCAYVGAYVGAAATQNVTDPRLGPALLAAMARGADAPTAVADVASAAAHAEFRQLAAVDGQGGSATFSGARALGNHAERSGANWAAVGNMMASASVLDAIAERFEASDAAEELESRLLAALAAGVEAGGEEGPLFAAGLLATGEGNLPWPATDLRVDFDAGSEPVAALGELWALWEPQRDDYVTRALDPASAPAYDVPGDPGAPVEGAR